MSCGFHRIVFWTWCLRVNLSVKLGGLRYCTEKPLYLVWKPWFRLIQLNKNNNNKKRIKKSSLKSWYWSVISINSVGLCQVVTARQQQTMRRSPRDCWNNYVSDLLAKCSTCGCNIGLHPRTIGRGNCHLCRKPPLDRVGWRGLQHQRHCQANAQLRRYAISSGELIKLSMKITYEVISLPQSIWHCSNGIRSRKSDLVPSWIKRRGTGRNP